MNTFEEEVKALIERNIEDRNERMAAVDELIAAYIMRSEDGAWPKGELLEKLTDYILKEEITDRSPDKVTNTEYPFFSEHQLALRDKREKTSDAIKYRDGFGRDRLSGAKIYRSERDIWKIEELILKRNQERRRRYLAFIRGKGPDVLGYTPKTVRIKE